MLGKVLYSNQQYKHAGPLLRISGHHLHLCGSVSVKSWFALIVLVVFAASVSKD